MAKRKTKKNETETSEVATCRHMEAHFNLIDKPWIPVSWKPEAKGLPGRIGMDARPVELGLRDTLLHAHEIAEVNDQSPLVTAALHRLLIAVVHAIYKGPEKSSDWVEMWQAGKFDSNKIIGYFRQWHDRFWLFHPERPFLQWIGEDLGNQVPSTLLNMALASTGEGTLFDHTLDLYQPGFTCAEASRQLLAFLSFKTGGFVEGVPGKRQEASALAAPWADGAVFLSQDESLFGTLMMNLLLPGARKGTPSELGAPEWEQSQPSPRTPPNQSARAGPPSGYLSFLTAPSRHVLLCPPGTNGTIRTIRLQLGTIFTADGPVDPAKTYYADKKKGWRPILLRTDRALWRDSAALLELTGDEHAQAGVLAQLALLRESELISNDLIFGLRAFGTIGDRAKLNLWKAETLPIPVSILGDLERRVLIEDCLGLAEEVAGALRSSVWVLACRLVPETKENIDRKAFRDHLDVTLPYWTALENPFKRDVIGLQKILGAEETRRRWAKDCIALAEDALAKTLRSLAASGRTLQAGAEAQRTLSWKLREIREKHNLTKE